MNGIHVEGLMVTVKLTEHPQGMFVRHFNKVGVHQDVAFVLLHEAFCQMQWWIIEQENTKNKPYEELTEKKLSGEWKRRNENGVKGGKRQSDLVKFNQSDN